MQRARTRGADIKGDPNQYNGINAEKCIKYLRGIGVEIDDATADAWMDVQATHRFLASEKSVQKTVGVVMCQACGWSTETVHTRGSRRKKQPTQWACPDCGDHLWHWRALYVVCRDGSVKDYRDKEDRWRGVVL